MEQKIKIHDNIYDKLAVISGIKFKTQLKGTEIYFKEFYKVKDIISEEEEFLLIFDNDKSIRFSTNIDFINKFIQIIYQNKIELDIEYDQLQDMQKFNQIIDENHMFLRYEYIGYCGNRLLKLSDKLVKSIK